MDFAEELARIATDPVICRFADRRAGSRELAEDAIQNTYWRVSQVKEPGRIEDLKAYFLTVLSREIHHQRAWPPTVPVEDIAAAAEREGTSSLRYPPPSVDSEASAGLLAQVLLTRLERDRSQLLKSVPARSPDPRSYRAAIVAAASIIMSLLLRGEVVRADWNAVLKAIYPCWFDEPGLGRDAIDQRLSRGRQDVRLLGRKLLPRHELD